MTGPIRAAIRGVGHSVPSRVMTNEDFEQFLETSDEWITKRTGIKERRIAADDQSTATFAAEAARAALADAGWAPGDLDLIVCATVTPELIFPSTACFVQQMIGATDVPAFDLSAACSGFVYALSAARGFIETGVYRRVLVIGADVMSKFTDYTDRGSCILFGDGAGAVVLEADENPDVGIQYTVMHADGTGWDYIHIPAGGTRTPPSHEVLDQRLQYVKMRGRDVYKFAVEKMQWLLGDCMSHCGLTPDDVDLVVPHQVNTRIIDSATEKFDFPLEKIYLNIQRYGNTSAGSVPIALSEARAEGRTPPGSTVLLIAFGAGLTWGGAVVKM